jgi:hypothetical protein
MMKTNAWALLFLAPFLTACGATKIVEKPVPVEVPGPTRFVEVPSDLTVLREKAIIPGSITYAELIEILSIDRSTIDTLNGQLMGIKSLQGTENDGT